MTCALFATLVLLADAPPQGEGARTDIYGDALPPGALARLGTIGLRHWGADVRFSMDGKQLISCGRDGEVRTWDVATGKLVRRQRLAWKSVEPPAFADTSLAPGSMTAAAYSGDTHFLYDATTGQEHGQLPRSGMLSFSLDGKKLVVQSWDNNEHAAVQLWDVVAFKKLLTLEPPDTILRSAAFAPDGKSLATLGGKTGEELLLWETKTGRLKSRKKFRSPLMSLTYAPEGNVLAVGLEDRVEVVLLDASTLKEKSILPVPANRKGAGQVFPLAFSADGRLLVGGCEVRRSGGCGVLLWDLTGPKEAQWLPAPSYIKVFAFAPDGKTLACCNVQSDKIGLWDLTSNRPFRPGHDTPVQVLAVSPDGKIIASNDLSPTIHLWNAANGKPLRALRGDDNWAQACLFSPDGEQVVSAGLVGTFQVWDAASGKELRRFEIDWPVRRNINFHAVGFCADGKRLAAIASGHHRSHPAQTLIWDIATGKQCSQQPYRLEECARGKPPKPWLSKAHAAFAPDGATMSVWLGKQVGIEEVATNSLLATLPQDVGDPLVFSPDGRLVAAAILQPKSDPSDGDDELGVALAEAASGGELWRMKIDGFRYAAFAPDGRSLIVADVKNLSVWNAFTGERLHKMAWPESVLDHEGEANILSLVVLPGGRAATGMSEGDILIWDLLPATWPVRRPSGELDRKKLDALGSDLCGEARKAYRAIHTLATTPSQTVPYLSDRLHPVALDTKGIEKLLADLEGEQFEPREAASRELAQMCYRAEPMLRRALAGKPSLEMRRRLQDILAAPRCPPPEALRTLRAIATLERIGTLEARRILVKLSGGAAAPETRAAKAALERLNRR